MHDIETALADLADGRAGLRLYGNDDLRRHLDAESRIGRIAGSVLGGAAMPVRAILFDKSANTNWALGWHQDRTIAVRSRRETPGFGQWTRKQGMLHVAPPTSVLARMVTLRVHLDPVPDNNAPLMIARGSHLLGAVAETDIDAVVAQAQPFACLAERGDIWLYATLILHASAAAENPTRRRVLQVDYASEPLSGGLEFLGV